MLQWIMTKLQLSTDNRNHEREIQDNQGNQQSQESNNIENGEVPISWDNVAIKDNTHLVEVEME